MPDDVEEREDACFRAVDDARLEVFEVAPAGGSGVGDGGHAAPKREAVGIHAVVAGVGATLAHPGKDVDVDVDEARSDIEPRDVDHLQGAGRIEAGGDRRHLAVRDGDITHGTDPVAGVDDVATFQQQIVLLLRLLGRDPADRGQHEAQAGGAGRLEFHGSSLVDSRAASRSTSRPGTRPCRACPPSCRP